MFKSLCSGLVLFACALHPAPVHTAKAQANQPRRAYPPRMEGAAVEVYKSVGDVRLNVYVFSPPGYKASDKSPAIVFFFGGGWTSGSPKQFEPHCRYLASRGMVAMAADYRVASRHQVKAVDCVRDAKSALRWIRKNAGRLGIDPERIVAGGGSAGGHLAAAAGTIEGFDEPGEDSSVSSRPNAMVLFNPAVVLAPVAGMESGKIGGLRDRLGVDPARLSPYHNVKKGAPPAVLFHGKADTTVPFVTAVLFCEAMKKAGNRCELQGYEGETHGFFNYGRGDNKAFLDTLRRADVFLASLGYLSGAPTLDGFDWSPSR